LPSGIGPAGQRETSPLAFSFAIVSSVPGPLWSHFVTMTFGVLCAAMLAQPAVAEIEEMVGLDHEKAGAGCQVPVKAGAGFRTSSAD